LRIVSAIAWPACGGHRNGAFDRAQDRRAASRANLGPIDRRNWLDILFQSAGEPGSIAAASGTTAGKLKHTGKDRRARNVAADQCAAAARPGFIFFITNTSGTIIAKAIPSSQKQSI